MDNIVGPNIRLRLVQPTDASYLFQLRTNPELNTHLSQISGTVEDQKAWIETYKGREELGIEFYFIIERHDETPCGTVRIYNIEGDTFTWGSWMLDSNKTHKAALESAMLSFQYAFQTLELTSGSVAVNIGNTHAEAFYRRFGMDEVCKSEKEILFTYSAAMFNKQKHDIMDNLDKAVNCQTGVI